MWSQGSGLGLTVGGLGYVEDVLEHIELGFSLDLLSLPHSNACGPLARTMGVAGDGCCIYQVRVIIQEGVEYYV